jgi:cell wall-associated NlpC family hydrolase
LREKLIKFIDKVTGIPFQDRGRDYSNLDCWGLIWLAYRDCFSLNLPCFENIPALRNREVRNAFEITRQQFTEIQDRTERPGDIAVFRGLPIHVGMVVQSGLMLHVAEDTTACIESYRNFKWKHTLIGFYRHAKLASDN